MTAYRLGGTTLATVKANLRDAIVSLLAGEEIAVTETPVDGCLITSASEAPPTKKYTYSEHIAPLMKNHCQRCHQPGTAAPFSLLSFDDVANHAEMIGEVVEQQRMPPWYASSKYGKFTNARTMPEADRAMLLDWVRSGAPRGQDESEQSEEPAAERHSDNGDPWAGIVWQMGEPDLVIEDPAVYDVPAEGYVDYKYALLPKVFLRNTWLEVCRDSAQQSSRRTSREPRLLADWRQPAEFQAHNRLRPRRRADAARTWLRLENTRRLGDRPANPYHHNGKAGESQAPRRISLSAQQDSEGAALPGA